MSLFPLYSLSKKDVPKINHASEYIETHFENNPGFGKYCECKIYQSSDLITDCYVKIKLPDLDQKLKWKKEVGKLLLKKIKFLVNGVVKEEYDADYLNIYNGLTLSCEKLKQHERMLSHTKSNDPLYIPLVFFFNKHKVNYLPIKTGRCAVGIEFEKLDRLVINQDNIDLSEFEQIQLDSVLALNNIYLDKKMYTELRDNPISQRVEIVDSMIYDIVNPEINDHTDTNLAYEHLKDSDLSILKINVLRDLIFQYLDYPDTKKPKLYNFAFDLNFIKKPCKELWWIIYPEDQLLEYVDIMQSGKISLNCYDRFSEQDRAYFTNYQQFKHHTNHMENVQVFSFSLNPENHDPDYPESSTIDFTKLDSYKLHLMILCPFDKFYKLKIYANQLDDFIVE